MRAVTPADVDALSSFLHETVNPAITASQWRALFEYGWDHDRPALGHVLVDGMRIVGFIGTVLSNRRIDGKIERFCNLSTWFVLPGYRNAALPLLLAAVGRTDETLTGLTPTKEAGKIYDWLGFRALDTGKLALLPFLNLRSLLAREPVRILTDRTLVREVLRSSDRVFFEDHSPYACGHFVVASPTSYAYVITKRRKKRGFPFSEVLYCSDIELFIAHLERIKWAVLRQERTVAVMIDRRLLRGRRPVGVTIRRPTLFKSKTLDAAEIDNLYSELVLLPN